MAYTTINKSTDHFNTKLYTGNGSTQSITGVGFQPDWTWIKKRNATRNHNLFDVIRGVQKALHSDANSAEATSANYLTAFGADGFSVGSSSNVNANSDTYASWNWKAGGSGSSNSDGSITSTVSANTTAGFSIVKYTGTGSNATVGHGLGASPKMIIFKNTNSTRDWAVYHSGMNDPDAYLALNQTYAKEDSYNFSNNTAPTSSVFSVGTLNGNNGSSQDYIAYCFAEKTGYSKFGTYEGNSSSDGTFVYTGFKPAWLLVKAASGSQTPQNQSWPIWDNKRSSSGGNNENSYKLYANATDAEATSAIAQVDLVSNGFKFRNSTHQSNSSNTYVYMAFGQSLVGSNNVPATAR